MADDAIRVVYRKYDGSLHWHLPVRRLGADEHGVWVGAPAGVVAWRGSEFALTSTEAQVVLFPRECWWTASFNAAPHRTEIYCDITTVPQWRGDEVSMVDLDLDVLRRRDGSVLIDDEDEFAEHQIKYGYPDSVIDEARKSCDWLHAAVSARSEPFGTDYQRWLEQIAL